MICTDSTVVNVMMFVICIFGLQKKFYSLQESTETLS